MSNEILLESGTNEVEVLEFYLGTQRFGINIAKIAQIIPYDERQLTAVPGDNPAIIGNLSWQDNQIPLISLDAVLGRKTFNNTERPIVLVTEFNGVRNGFLTNGVNRIHRISWEQIDPISSLFERHNSACIGSIHIDEKDILLIDFEYIIAGLYPETSVAYHNVGWSSRQGRDARQIVLAEDSSFIRQTILTNMKNCGYENVRAFENGADACLYLEKCLNDAKAEGRGLESRVSIVVTDIEMPKMDGLALCKKVKEDMAGSHIPVIVFSSLINEAMEYKCREVGADAYMTKPRITELVEVMDSLLGLKEHPEGAM
jgi:two-component system chemotaxis response regulator CheV